jgi:DNA-binding response OmpR family regulator
MRPPKCILLASEDDIQASILSFTLRTHYYEVFWRDKATAAEQVLGEEIVDLLLILCPFGNAVELVKRAIAIAPDTPMLVVTARGQTGAVEWPSHAVVLKGRNSSAELLERIKYMVARKHGPRPGTHHLKTGAERRSLSCAEDGRHAQQADGSVVDNKEIWRNESWRTRLR